MRFSAENRHAGIVLGALAGALGLTPFALAAQPDAEPGLRPYAVVGDAIPASLTGKPGNPARGRAIVTDRQVGMCVLCHAGPFPNERFQGNIGPGLQGTGSRWNEGQLRLRIVDASRINPATIMPPYYRIEGLARVAPPFRGKPILSAEQIEDVVAYLETLRAPSEEKKPR